MTVRTNPGFRRLWLATAISALGTFVGSLALMWTAVSVLHASPAQMAWLAMAQLIAAFIAAPIGGVIVDRFRRRPLMIAADIVRAVALASIPIVQRSGHLTFGWLMVVGVLTSASNVVFNSAYGAHLPRLVGREHLVQAHATTAATISLAEIAGFSAAGWLVEWLGATDALYVDAASFLASAICIVAIAAPEPSRAPRGAQRRRGPSVDEITAGVRYAVREPVLRSLLGSAALYDTALGLTTASYMLYLARDLGFREGLLGSIFAIGGLTSLIGSRWATKAEQAGRIGRAMAVAGFVRTAGVAAMPAAFDRGTASTGFLVANQVITDPAWMLQEVAEGSIRQSRTPDEFAGRIAGASQLAGTTGRLAGTGLAWAIGSTAGPRWSLWCAVGFCLLASVWVAVSATGRVRRAAIDPSMVNAAAEVVTAEP